MDDKLRLSDIFPEILQSNELPCSLHKTQSLSSHPRNKNGDFVEFDPRPHLAKVNIYDNIICVLRHAPRKHISRMFQ